MGCTSEISSTNQIIKLNNHEKHIYKWIFLQNEISYCCSQHVLPSESPSQKVWKFSFNFLLFLKIGGSMKSQASININPTNMGWVKNKNKLEVDSFEQASSKSLIEKTCIVQACIFHLHFLFQIWTNHEEASRSLNKKSELTFANINVSVWFLGARRRTSRAQVRWRHSVSSVKTIF